MAESKFHWGLVDHRLVGLKLTNLAEEMHESIRAEIGQIQFDNSATVTARQFRHRSLRCIYAALMSGLKRPTGPTVKFGRSRGTQKPLLSFGQFPAMRSRQLFLHERVPQ